MTLSLSIGLAAAQAAPTGAMDLNSLTGLLLIFFLQKKRLSGLLAAFAGAALCYLAWVP